MFPPDSPPPIGCIISSAWLRLAALSGPCFIRRAVAVSHNHRSICAVVPSTVDPCTACDVSPTPPPQGAPAPRVLRPRRRPPHRQRRGVPAAEEPGADSSCWRGRGRFLLVESTPPPREESRPAASWQPAGRFFFKAIGHPSLHMSECWLDGRAASPGYPANGPFDRWGAGHPPPVGFQVMPCWRGAATDFRLSKYRPSTAGDESDPIGARASMRHLDPPFPGPRRWSTSGPSSGTSTGASTARRSSLPPPPPPRRDARSTALSHTPQRPVLRASLPLRAYLDRKWTGPNHPRPPPPPRAHPT